NERGNRVLRLAQRVQERLAIEGENSLQKLGEEARVADGLGVSAYLLCPGQVLTEQGGHGEQACPGEDAKHCLFPGWLHDAVPASERGDFPVDSVQTTWFGEICKAQFT